MVHIPKRNPLQKKYLHEKNINMTEQEVKEIIAKDMQAINDAPFPEPLPDWLLDGFGKIIMETPQKDCPYFADTIRKILAKKPNDLTVYEGGFVLNLLTATTPKNVAKNLNQFLDRKGQIERIMYRFNTNMKREERKLEIKESTLLRASRPRILTH